jgi:hypothetical protein
MGGWRDAGERLSEIPQWILGWNFGILMSVAALVSFTSILESLDALFNLVRESAVF